MKRYSIIFKDGNVVNIDAKTYGWPQTPGNVLLYLYNDDRDTKAMYNVKNVIGIFEVKPDDLDLDRYGKKYYISYANKENPFVLLADHHNYIPYANQIDFFDTNNMRIGTFNLDTIYGFQMEDKTNEKSVPDRGQSNDN